MSRRPSSRKNKARRSLRSRIITFLIGLSAFALLGGVFLYVSVYFGFWGPLPSEAELESIQQSEASLIQAQDGTVIDKIYRVNRSRVSYQDLRPHLVQALVATEDERFFEHSGVDWRSLARVFFKTILLQDRSSGGGSTLSQQLAKNLFGRKDFGAISILINKLKEIIIAQRLEGVYSKEEILALYFNTVSFSENTYGIGAGSQRFFDRSVSALQIEEGAVLVGLLKANTYYNPRLNPKPALQRRNVVLRQMERNGFLSSTVADSLSNLELDIRYKNLNIDGPAPYFSAQVQAELRTLLEGRTKSDGSPWDPRSDGLIIKTTLDLDKQKALQAAYDQHLASWQDKFDAHWRGSDPWRDSPRFYDRQKQATPYYQQLAAAGLSEEQIEARWEQTRAMELYRPGGNVEADLSMNDSLRHYLKLLRGASVILDPKQGGVKAWIGGPNYRYLPFDAAAAPHPLASTFKPVVIAAALEAGYKPCDYQSAEQRRYPEYDDWTPRNYDNDYQGLYSMGGTLEKSVNTATVAWFMEVGGAEVRDLSRSLGLGPELPEGPTIALGTLSASPLQVAVVYATFANGGYKVQPYFIESISTKEGHLLFKREPDSGRRVLSEETSRLMNALLQGVTNKGTARSLRSRFGVKQAWAAKTGTSQNYSDAWFTAYSPHEVSVSWMGGVSPLIRFRSGAYGSGSTMALPVFGLYAQKSSPSFQWPQLSDAEKELLDCPAYREENFWDKMKGVFSKDPGQTVPSDPQDTNKKKSWFDRLFRRND